MNTNNLILDTDSYKQSHWSQYPKDATNILSTIEARGSNIPGITHTIFFGLQPVLNKLTKRITEQDITEAELVCKAHGVPFNLDLWEEVLVRNRGCIPLKIEALPEGTFVPHRVPMVRVTATDPRFMALVSHFETMLLRAVWYPSTVATISNSIYQMMAGEFGHQVSDLSELDFKLHDFGARGASSAESAAIGGLAHLLSFRGTDTMGALLAGVHHYNANLNTLGFSIPASEHSTMTAWGKDGELDAYANMVEQYAKPGKIFACVSDSYDIFSAVTKWHRSGLFDIVKERGATVVIRPDSGDPVNVIIRLLELLFMYTKDWEVRPDGLKVLPKHIRLIQGDGVNPESIRAILKVMEVHGYSMHNIAFGMGGALLQKVDRDTFKFAQKSSAIETGSGNWKEIFKDPVTDPGKKSHRGIVNVVAEESGELRCLEQQSEMIPGSFRKVFENGSRWCPQSFDEVRERVRIGTLKMLKRSR